AAAAVPVRQALLAAQGIRLQFLGDAVAPAGRNLVTGEPPAAGRVTVDGVRGHHVESAWWAFPRDSAPEFRASVAGEWHFLAVDGGQAVHSGLLLGLLFVAPPGGGVVLPA